MSPPIGDYALLGNLRSAALVSRYGSIDWYCPGRFDASACFSKLLGDPDNGFWQISPTETLIDVERHYQTDTLILETRFTTSTGQIKLVDFMPVGERCQIVRVVECLAGRVPLSMRLVPRFHFGRDHPSRVSDRGDQRVFKGDQDAVSLSSNLAQIPLENGSVGVDFELEAGEHCWFVLSHVPREQITPEQVDLSRVLPIDPLKALEECACWWRDWISQGNYEGRWEKEVKRSLITLKAMIYAPTGGMVAAPTTSIPEVPGGQANYDYRFCWIRDAAFALKVFLNEGFKQEACQWRDWLLKALAQHDEPLHALYTIDATVAPPEQELTWLSGFMQSKPVRAGNAASRQYQIDLRGELMEVLHLARSNGLELEDEIWQAQCDILADLKHHWHQPDAGMWEFRTLCEHLTHSKVLAWVAYDRSICDAERFDLPAPLAEWRQLRDEIRADVLERGLHPDGYFTQTYGASEVDASLLMLPLVGFLPADDPRILATVAKIERDLCENGLIRRYRKGDQANVEGMFLPCCFWLVDNYWLAGRKRDAEILFQRLLGLTNDLGLLAEEYHLDTQQLMGNFPQGLSHLALISSARLLATDSEAEIRLD